METRFPYTTLFRSYAGGQHAGEAHHLPTGDEPDAHVRVEELGPVRCDRDVACGDPVEAGAAAQPVDGHDGGLGHRAERRGALLRSLPLRVGRQVGLVVDHTSVLWDLLYVGAGAERPPGDRKNT